MSEAVSEVFPVLTEFEAEVVIAATGLDIGDVELDPKGGVKVTFHHPLDRQYFIEEVFATFYDRYIVRQKQPTPDNHPTASRFSS